MSTSPRAYLEEHVARPYQPRVWDCAKLAVGWLGVIRPEAATAAARLLVEHGYNDFEPGDAHGLERVFASVGARTAPELALWLYDRLRDHLHPVSRPRPGDIAINGVNLAFGIVDGDYHATYLAETGGYAKWPARPGDALLRAL